MLFYCHDVSKLGGAHLVARLAKRLAIPTPRKVEEIQRRMSRHSPTCVKIYTYIYIYIYIHPHIYVYIYIYIYMHIRFARIYGHYCQLTCHSRCARMCPAPSTDTTMYSAPKRNAFKNMSQESSRPKFQDFVHGARTRLRTVGQDNV